MKFLHSPAARLASYIALLLLLGGLLASQKSDLVAVWRASRDVRLPWLGIGGGAMVLSVLCTACVYRALTPKRLAVGPLLLVQMSGLFVNKLLPSGSGAAGVSYLFLRASKVPTLRSLIIVTLNNLLGFTGHMTLLVVALLVFGSAAAWPTVHWSSGGSTVPILGVVLAACLLTGGWIFMKARFKKLSHQTVKEVRVLLRRPQVLSALAWSMLLTACYVAALYAACGAAHVPMRPLQLLIVLTLSVAATAVVPVPGGIGAAEAGIFLGLRAYGIEAPTALLVAFMYRLMTFWAPLGVGALAFMYVEGSGLLRIKK